MSLGLKKATLIFGSKLFLSKFIIDLQNKTNLYKGVKNVVVYL